MTEERVSRPGDSTIQERLAKLEIETPSWGYADSGTRFGVFPQENAPRDVFERVDDAAEVHRLTGTAPAVALHFPWDAVDDLRSLRCHIEARGLRTGAVNPNLFQDPDYKLGSITNPDPAIRAKALEHLLDCVRIATELGSTAQSLWLADGINYAGQDDLRERRRRMRAALETVYAALPPEQELLVEYKPFEPAFYATDLADWGSAVLLCRSLGERARVLVDLGHHLQGANIEQIVALLAMEDRLGGVHLNGRRYADDDLIVGSTDPFGLFLIFVELTADGAPLPRLTIDQSFNIEPKVEAMVHTVMNIQEAYAKALNVDRGALRAAQEAGDTLGGHRVLMDAFTGDVRELCARTRRSLGAETDPIAALRATDQAARRAAGPGAPPAGAAPPGPPPQGGGAPRRGAPPPPAGGGGGGGAPPPPPPPPPAGRGPPRARPRPSHQAWRGA
jgi:L-rhamnose isomerase/sugar isomerase